MLLPLHLHLSYYPSSPPSSVRSFPTGGPGNSNFLESFFPIWVPSFSWSATLTTLPRRNVLLVLVVMSRRLSFFLYYVYYFCFRFSLPGLDRLLEGSLC